jgi:alpha-N-acetylglucosaminidase
LSRWVKYARDFGDTEEEKNYYESNAKRLITTWGGWVNEYAARTWSGLIGDYYAMRWKKWLEAKKGDGEFDVLDWEEEWINSEYTYAEQPFSDPIAVAKSLIDEYKLSFIDENTSK